MAFYEIFIDLETIHLYGNMAYIIVCAQRLAAVKNQGREKAKLTEVKDWKKNPTIITDKKCFSAHARKKHFRILPRGKRSTNCFDSLNICFIVNIECSQPRYNNGMQGNLGETLT